MGTISSLPKKWLYCIVIMNNGNHTVHLENKSKFDEGWNINSFHVLKWHGRQTNVDNIWKVWARLLQYMCPSTSHFMQMFHLNPSRILSRKLYFRMFSICFIYFYHFGVGPNYFKRNPPVKVIKKRQQGKLVNVPPHAAIKQDSGGGGLVNIIFCRPGRSIFSCTGFSCPLKGTWDLRIHWLGIAELIMCLCQAVVSLCSLCPYAIHTVYLCVLFYIWYFF